MVDLRKIKALIIVFSENESAYLGLYLLEDSFYTHFLSWPYRRRVRKNLSFPCFAISLFLWTV